MKTCHLGSFLIGFVANPLAGVAATFIVTNPGDSGPGSLRQRILDANANPGLDTIHFNLPGGGVHTIYLFSALPIITNAAIIDGTSQPGYADTPLIEISGANAGNSADGLDISAGQSTIRGLAINGFSGAAISLSARGGNTIQANYLGTDPSGTSAKTNGGAGIVVGPDVHGNLIGGTDAADRNVISGNRGAGIAIGSETWHLDITNNVILGNFIGTDRHGSNSIPNLQGGITMYASPRTQIGGTAPGAGNLIAGNALWGIYIQDGGSNTIQGNLIGTDRTGTKTLGNFGSGWGSGIYLGYSVSNLVGGTTAGARNIISGNTGTGLTVYSGPNWIEGNYIGLDVSGTRALPNGSGVSAGGPAVIGGPNPLKRNIISGNVSDGITVYGGKTVIQGNYIGTDVTGMVAISNGANGISLSTAISTLVGGAGSGNLISGNGSSGIMISDNNLEQGTNNWVLGNLIGTDVTGLRPLSNGLAGIAFQAAGGHCFIGGTNRGEGNVISGNPVGIAFYLNGYAGYGRDNIFRGNLIGIGADGVTSVPNLTRGILFSNGANLNIVGGVGSGVSNIIAYNGGAGIRVAPSYIDAKQNTISGNSIFANGGLGIDLGLAGVTANDARDFDAGPNNLNNFPILVSATNSDGWTVLVGTLNSIPNSTLTLEFFSSRETDPSTYGQGQSFIGSTNITTDTDGNASFAAILSPAVQSGDFISATSTDPGGSTSEFSQCVLVGQPRLKCAKLGSNCQVSWTSLASGYHLEAADRLTPPVQWTTVTNTAALTNGLNNAVITISNSGSQFYRLATP